MEQPCPLWAGCLSLQEAKEVERVTVKVWVWVRFRVRVRRRGRGMKRLSHFEVILWVKRK